jgi:hypothetical protein
MLKSLFRVADIHEKARESEGLNEEANYLIKERKYDVFIFVHLFLTCFIVGFEGEQERC